ncbi:MAG: leucine-rich repeat domain-containing protein [Promethearchaeia archaeon]
MTRRWLSRRTRLVTLPSGASSPASSSAPPSSPTTRDSTISPSGFEACGQGLASSAPCEAPATERPGLSALPLEVTALPGLTELSVSYNRLTRLPAELAALSHLTRLRVADNSLVALPPELGLLDALTDLDVSGNALESGFPTDDLPCVRAPVRRDRRCRPCCARPSRASRRACLTSGIWR